MPTASVIAAACALVAAVASGAPVVQLDAWGTDSVRIRIAPSGGAIVDPPFSPLIIPHPSFVGGVDSTTSSPLHVTNGNLAVTATLAPGSSAQAALQMAPLSSRRPPFLLALLRLALAPAP